MRTRPLPPLLALLWLALTAATFPTGVVDTTIETGMDLPVGLAILPDGRVLVAEKLGDLEIVTLAGQRATVHTFGDLWTGSEGGLLDVAVDPRWPAEPYVYVHYTTAAAQPTAIVIERWLAQGDLSDSSSTSLTLTDPVAILDDLPNDDNSHNGGTLAFRSDSTLYVSLGEDFQFCVAQDSTTLLGCILRLDVMAVPDSGGHTLADLVPDDNPYAANPDASALVYAHGFRNPYRCTVDPLTDVLYVGDVGSDFYEEVNEVQAGDNCGWPFFEGDTTVVTWNCDGEVPRPLEEPIFSLPANPLTGTTLTVLAMYRDNPGQYAFPAAYDGVLFFSEIFTMTIYTLRNEGGNWTAFAWGQEDGLPLDGEVGPDGALYYVMWTGQLKRLEGNNAVTGVEPTPPTRPLAVIPNPVRAGRAVEFAEAGVKIFNLQGRLVDTVTGTQWRAQVAPGVYFARSKSGTGRITVLP